MNVEKYIKTTASGVGFITFEDQEVDGLQFAIISEDETYNFVKVNGEELKVNAWVTRVSGTDMTAEEIIKFTPQPVDPNAPEPVSLIEQIAALKDENLSLGQQLFDLQTTLIAKGVI